MSFSGFVVQLLNGLAGASSLFLVAAGLSLIFGVTRIVNFTHGSFFMVGIYLAYTLVDVEGTVPGDLLDRIKGDHHTFKHEHIPDLISIAHPKKDLAIGQVRAIYRIAGWKP